MEGKTSLMKGKAIDCRRRKEGGGRGQGIVNDSSIGESVGGRKRGKGRRV